MSDFHKVFKRQSQESVNLGYELLECLYKKRKCYLDIRSGFKDIPIIGFSARTFKIVPITL